MSTEECLCSICDENFSCVSILRRHIKTSHKNVFCCPLCAKSFQERPELDNHLLTHTSDIPSDDSASEDDSLGCLAPEEVSQNPDKNSSFSEKLESFSEKLESFSEKTSPYSDKLESFSDKNAPFSDNALSSLQDDEEDQIDLSFRGDIPEDEIECDVVTPSQYIVERHEEMLETVNTEEEEEEPPAMKYPGVIPLSEMNTDFRVLSKRVRKQSGRPRKHKPAPRSPVQENEGSPTHVNVQDYIASFSQSLAPQFCTDSQDRFTVQGRGEMLDLDVTANNFKSTLFLEEESCSECGLLFSSSDVLYQHLATHHDQIISSYSCLYCSHVYFSPSEVMSHLRSVLSPATPDFIHLEAIKRSSRHPCPVCNINHLSAHKLKLHILKGRCSQKSGITQCKNITKSKLQCMKLILQKYKPKNILTEPATARLSHASTETNSQAKSYQELYAQTSTYLTYPNNPLPPTQSVEKKGYTQQSCTCGSINCRSCQPQRPSFPHHFLQHQPFRAPVYTSYNNQQFTPLYPPQIQSNIFTPQQTLQFNNFPNAQLHSKGPITGQPLSHLTHNTHPQPNKGPMACFQCNRKYDNFEVLLEHVRNECQYTQQVQ